MTENTFLSLFLGLKWHVTFRKKDAIVDVTKTGMTMMRKTALRILTGILVGLWMAACGQEGSSQRDSTPSMGSEISFRLPFSHIPGLTATLKISEVGTFPMSVNPDGTVSVTVPAIPIGWRTFTITYYATFNGSQVILAQATTPPPGAEVVANQTTRVEFLPQDLDRNFDKDEDGWVNLAEILLGTNPLLASSRPPGDDPRFALVTTGMCPNCSSPPGLVQSASYTLFDAVGEAVGAAVKDSQSSGESTGDSFSVTGGFQAYP